MIMGTPDEVSPLFFSQEIMNKLAIKRIEYILFISVYLNNF